MHRSPRYIVSEFKTILKRRLRPGILNIHCIDLQNVGDLASSPFNYFATDKPVYKMNFWDLDAGQKPRPNFIPIVLGGGGLYYSPETILKLATTHKGPLIAWGLGRNSSSSINNSAIYLGEEQFSLFGVRDWDDERIWVPCVSCMSYLFDYHRKSTPLHDVVVYEHKDMPISIATSGFPVLKNSDKFENIIKFLASGDTVLTNSYHGVYWATLLGKKVLAIPSSNRFTAFRFPPVLTTLDEWMSSIYKGKSYPDSLEICQEQNLNFSLLVQNILQIKLWRKVDWRIPS
ncbi:MAG: hypothetical protein ACK6BC_00130 [Cyanobacteriota bacterium]|jgi:hypothetical protein